MKLILALVALGAAVFAQTSPLDGNVTDPQGAAILGAAVEVVNAENGQTYRTTTDDHGHWVVTSIPAGVYRVSVAFKGFRTALLDNVKIDAGVAATANAKLEVGQATETVEVNAGAELVQASDASVSTTLQGQQINALPFTSRNALELLVTQPGTQTGTTPRGSQVNGLPFSALNITMDGINTQDNLLKSSDGFFTNIPAHPDALEEVTMTTSAASADSLAGGAAQIRFVTKGGTNTFHGGVNWQHRNTDLNANYYFNTINRQPRDAVILNQGGVNIGGPIVKNRLHFFTNYEIYRYPAQTSATRTVLAPSALDGTYTYADSSKKNPDGTPLLHQVNVLALAGAAGFVSTEDPIIQSTLQKINGLTANGILQSRVSSSNDYTRNNLLFQPKGLTSTNYDTTRIDYTVNSKNQVSVVWTYYTNNSVPDITNNVVPIYPGTGTILGNPMVAGQRGNRYLFTASLRSTITNRLVNQFRAGQTRSLTLFRDQVSSPSLFSDWKGYSPTLGFGLTNVAAVSGSSRRTSPVREIHDDLSYSRGSHLISFGGSFTQVNLWQQTFNSNVIPTVAFGLATGDPINTGSTNIFTSANFPGSTSTDLSNAGALYALLTGRVSSIGRNVSLDGNTHQYANVPQLDNNHQREWGVYLQDTWRLSSSLTVSLGLRFQQQRPLVNLNGTYSAVSIQSLWGVSGVGNLFEPGVTTGVHPTFTSINGDIYKVPNSWDPSIGLAWQAPGMNGPLGWLFGHEKGKSVLRAGYAISTLREGTNTYLAVYGANVGVTASDSVDPNGFPQYFGVPGSVLFRNALPSRPAPVTPAYPITPAVSDSLNAFDPNLKIGYVQSWNLELQRELSHSTALDVRYTGNHGVGEWRQYNLNEVNTFENGFQKEFYAAQNNLAIANGVPLSQLFTIPTANLKNNFGNQGLPGQVNIPILTTALSGATADTTIATQLARNQVGGVARDISTNTTRMSRLLAAGYPPNFFVVNPDVAGSSSSNGGAFLVSNLGFSYYDALQVELRRRMASGLLAQGSYVWAKSISDGALNSSSDFSSPTTFRDIRLDRVVSGQDIRHAFKLDWIYELPVGPGRHFLPNTNHFVKKAVEGWQISGVTRIQSGTPFQLTSGRTGMNQNEAGVVLHNLTAGQLQDMLSIRKTTGSNGIGQVFYLPQSIIDNTNAAFEVNGKSLANLNPSAPYIGPQLAPGQFGYRVYLYNPWQYHLDVSLVKITPIKERVRMEFRAQALDVLNLTNFFIANGPSSASFGQTTTAYRDFSGSADPGSRIVEFLIRVSF